MDEDMDYDDDYGYDAWKDEQAEIDDRMAAQWDGWDGGEPHPIKPFPKRALTDEEPF